MNENYYELNLGNLFLYILRKYKKVLVMSAVMAILFGAFKFASIITHNSKITVTDAQKAEFEKKLGGYDERVLAKEDDIVNQESKIDNLLLYESESIIYNLNPDETYVYEKYYFVDTNYYIMPDMSYQNINYTNTVGNLYISFLNATDNKQTLSNNLSIQELYLSEIYSIKYSDSLISLKVYGENEEFCQKIVDEIDKAINRIGNQINQRIVEHDLSVLSINKCYCYSSVVEKAINAKDNNMNSYMNAIEADNKDIKQINEEREQYIAEFNSQFVKQPFLKDSFIFSIIGFVVGLLSMLVALFINFVFSNKMYDYDDLSFKLDAKTISRLNKRGKEDKVCAFVSKRENRAINANVDDCCKLALSNIKALDINPKSILIAGDVSTDKLDLISMSFKKLNSNIVVSCGKDFVNDSTILDKLHQVDFVVILVEADVSEKSFIKEEINIVKSIKSNYGCIVIE